MNRHKATYKANNDKYILLGISNYNPQTEIGKVQVIKKVSYIDYV